MKLLMREGIGGSGGRRGMKLLSLGIIKDVVFLIWERGREGAGEGGMGWKRHPGSPSEVGSVRAAHVTGAGGASTNETSSARSRGNAASAAPPGASGKGVASAASQSTYLRENRIGENGSSVRSG